jgi:hypothetical protein
MIRVKNEDPYFTCKIIHDIRLIYRNFAIYTHC